VRKRPSCDREGQEKECCRGYLAARTGGVSAFGGGIGLGGKRVSKTNLILRKNRWNNDQKMQQTTKNRREQTEKPTPHPAPSGGQK